jgi:uncharacterized Fe-S cluster-containing radical SAM superfamily protein
MMITDRVSAKYRSAMIDLVNRRLLLTNFIGTEQEHDLTEPPNCGGYGRIRHFRRWNSDDWPSNPLPIEPACQALGLPPTNLIRAQVFQNAACNWRCWYCFVPFNLLAANLKHAGWLTPADLVDAYLAQPDPPSIIDLTGGQPDLTPEWVLWMMDELEQRGLTHKVYLWSDDNLSTDYFWQVLSEAERVRIATYPMYGRVCCFKGFDATSFTFNTRAEPECFDRQFHLMDRLLGLGIDLYAYATFTSPQVDGIADSMARFVERLQQLDENLPLRTIPLQIQIFNPVLPRLTESLKYALVNQRVAVEAWMAELDRRFSSDMRSTAVSNVLLRGRKKLYGTLHKAFAAV